MTNMRAQAEKFGAEMIDDDIVSVNLTGTIKEVTDSEGTVHRAKTVIIATGSGYRKLGRSHEERAPAAGRYNGKTAQQGVSQWQSHDHRNPLRVSMSVARDTVRCDGSDGDRRGLATMGGGWEGPRHPVRDWI